jgi:hypothetical protein
MDGKEKKLNNKIIISYLTNLSMGLVILVIIGQILLFFDFALFSQLISAIKISEIGLFIRNVHH